MSKEKTFVTEISLAHGITNFSMGIKNLSIENEKFYNESSLKHIELTNTFKNIGQRIRNYLMSKNIDCSEIVWSGLEMQLRQDQIAAQDLEISGVPISIKENSNVIINGSASKVFESIPAGIIERGKKSKNWYIHTSPELFNTYFEICANELNFPTKSYKEFIKLSKPERKLFTYAVRELHNKNITNVIEAYNKLCKDISEKSASLFNQIVSSSLQNQNALKVICQEFFRIDNKEHFLAGIDNNEPFVCIVPKFDEWNESYEVLQIEAKPLEKGQPEVLLSFSFKDKLKNTIHNLSLKVEIRWSHGKFSGNPEAKIYKCWKYLDLPWAKKID